MQKVKRISLICFLIVSTIVVLELGSWITFRIIYPLPDPLPLGTVMSTYKEGILDLQWDRNLGWKLEPNYSVAYENSFDSLSGTEHLPGNEGYDYKIETNSYGYRGPKFPKNPEADTFRIICMGGSTTFGFPLGYKDSYPYSLENELRRTYPNKNIEVINAGVFGYTSTNVRYQLEGEILQYEPDLIIVDVGVNDSAREQPLTPRKWANHWMSSNIYMLRLFLKIVPPKNRAKQEWPMKVSRDQFSENLTRITEMAQDNGTDVILVNMNFRQWIYKDVRKEVAANYNIPLLEAHEEFMKAEWAMYDELTVNSPAEISETIKVPDTSENSDSLVPFLFRVTTPDNFEHNSDRYYLTYHAIADAVFEMWPQDGQWDQVKHPMYDDGTHGDSVENDGVWSVVASLPKNRLVKFFYLRGGGAGKWEVTDLGPHPAYQVYARWVYTSDKPLSSDAVRKRPEFYLLPIHKFGTHHFLSEAIHPNAAGNLLIAKELTRIIRPTPNLSRFLTNTDN